jgi:hypothetical protein
MRVQPTFDDLGQTFRMTNETMIHLGTKRLQIHHQRQQIDTYVDASLYRFRVGAQCG